MLVHDLAVAQRLTRAELEERWTGRIILVTRRATLSDRSRRFDVTSFLQAMHKYRRLLGEVPLASFFLQLFALVTPLGHLRPWARLAACPAAHVHLEDFSGTSEVASFRP